MEYTLVLIFMVLIGLGVVFYLSPRARNYISHNINCETCDTLLTAGVRIVYLIIALVIFRSCSSSSGGGASLVGNGASLVGNGILIFVGGGLIVAAVIARENGWLPYTFIGLAGLILLVLLGLFGSLFSWTVVGLPLFAAGGIWGSIKTEGRIRAFLGFVSGIVILYWLYLFYQGHPIGNTGFIGTKFFADGTQKSISLMFLAMFLFATWKKSKILYLISFILLVSWIGNANFVKIGQNYPNSLKLSLPTSLSNNKVVGALGEYIESLTTRFNASANREAVNARRDSLERKTWRIKPGTRVYNCQSGNCILEELKYDAEENVISLGDAVEVNGITYEKSALPDPKTNQPGKIVGWIMSKDLVASAVTVRKILKIKNHQRGVLVAVVARSNNRFANAIGGKALGPGKYYYQPAGNTSFQFAGERLPRFVGNGREFTILPGQKVLGVRTLHPSVKIYKIQIK